jgi:hypothetical protein
MKAAYGCSRVHQRARTPGGSTTRAGNDAVQVGTQCQHFIPVHGPIANLFHLHRKHMTAADHRDIRAAAMAVWSEIALSTAA